MGITESFGLNLKRRYGMKFIEKSVRRSFEFIRIEFTDSEGLKNLDEFTSDWWYGLKEIERLFRVHTE